LNLPGVDGCLGAITKKTKKKGSIPTFFIKIEICLFVFYINLQATNQNQNGF